ncbi:MAG: A24 family peptidase [Pirellulales bacterium]
MNALDTFIAWPLGVRCALVALAGLMTGAVVNWATYSLAYHPTYLSPWSRRHPRDAASSLLDRLPIIGWRRLRRREGQERFPVGFWVRPLTVEAGCAAGFVAWYWYVAVTGGLLYPRIAPGIIAFNPELSLVLHAECAAQLTLFAFMLAASLIDLDEWNIPDAITIPGTLLGVALLTWLPAQLPAFFDRRVMVVPLPLDAAMPFGWPPAWNAGQITSLLVAVGCLIGWCFALLVGGRFPRLREGRRRYAVAFRLFLRRILRDPAAPWTVAVGIAGSAAVYGVWKFAPTHWYALLSSLLGLAGGGAMVWAVRILGGWAFQKEAMGFGDVTLMAMIGAFIGWQPTLLVFFAAPVAALVIYVPALIFRRHEELPYGPYLCVSTLGVLWLWGPIWDWSEPRFEVAWIVPTVLLIGFPLYGVLRMLVLKLRSRPAKSD